MQKDLGDRLYQQKYISLILKDVKQFFSDLLTKTTEKISSPTYSVKVENPDTNLIKEVAESTRKSASRLKELLEVKKQEFPKEMNVRVTNYPKIEFPKFPEPKSEVKITNLKDFPVPKPTIIEKVDISSLEKLLNDVKSALSSINDQLPKLKQEKITFPAIPKPQKFPDSISLKESDALLTQLEDVNDNLVELHKAITELEVGGSGGGAVSISSPTVTSVNVNALRGIPKSTSITVGTEAMLLPPTPLAYRKSLIIYNNSSNIVYLGGFDVTTSNGLPVLAGAYSPSIDAGSTMDVYAVAGSSSNIRVLEVSSEREGA